MTEPTFITTIYGPAYAPFLGPHLHSICRCYPQARGIVLWQDVPAREISLLAAAYPNWRFVQTSEALQGELHQRIARKLHAWKQACTLVEGGPLAFLDIDALLVRRLDEFFTGSWDITYTWKDELFPINTGVMLASKPEAALALFEHMTRRVERIVRDPGQLQTALGSSGAADQHALREIIGFCNYDRYAVRTIGGRELVFRGIPCRQLNETNCRPMSEDLSIIHYKTGWHPILLQGREWTQNRPESRCREMFEHWHTIRRSAEAELADSIISAAARAFRGRFETFADSYEERGILNSEMLAVCGTCSLLNVDLVIESGRARGQSTRVLARYFGGTPTRIISVELERDADAIFAEEQLTGFKNLDLLYGDSLKLLPEIIAGHRGRRIAILLDGPKGKAAIDLMDRCFAESPDVVCGFIHDMRRQTPQREMLDGRGCRAFFTDDEEYLRDHAALDRACLPGTEAAITVHTWRPHMKGEDAIPSYGPTLAAMFPSPASDVGTHAQHMAGPA